MVDIDSLTYGQINSARIERDKARAERNHWMMMEERAQVREGADLIAGDDGKE